MKKNKKYATVVVMGILALIVAGCNGQHADKYHVENETVGHDAGVDSHADEIRFTRQQAQVAALATETVRPAAFSSVIRTSGQVETLQGDEQTIVATTAGVVFFKNASLAEGAAVKKGETVVTISAKTLQDGDPVMKAKAEFESAEKEYLRAKRLVVDKIISEKAFEESRVRYETARAAFQGQAGSITSNGMSVASPISGYVKSRLVGQGEYVSVGQAIAVVARNRRLQLRADVSESNFKHLREIRSANFKMSYDDNVYRLSDMNGRLLSYGKSADGGVSYIPVTFEFDNVGDIVPGAFAEVYLLTAARDNVITVPVSALTEEQGLFFVYLKVADEVFRKQEVVVGQDDGDRIEIVKGLKSGDVVVTEGASQVRLASVASAIPEHTHSH